MIPVSLGTHCSSVRGLTAVKVFLLKGHVPCTGCWRGYSFAGSVVPTQDYGVELARKSVGCSTAVGNDREVHAVV